MPQENAHFQAADMIISAMETMKWDLLSGQRVEIRSPDEAGGSPGGDSGGSEVAVYTHGRQDSGSSTSSDSGCEGTWGGRGQLHAALCTSIYLLCRLWKHVFKSFVQNVLNNLFHLHPFCRWTWDPLAGSTQRLHGCVCYRLSSPWTSSCVSSWQWLTFPLFLRCLSCAFS